MTAMAGSLAATRVTDHYDPAMSKPLGPYSPTYRAGDLVFVSGQVGIRDGALVDGGVTAQTRQVFVNIGERLAEVGAALTDVVKTTCFLTDMADFAEFNEAYIDGFGEHRPARSTVAVAGLPAGAVVEIELVVHRP